MSHAETTLLEMISCPDCGNLSLIVNIWGYPIESEISSLEAEDHVVNLQGCIPPLKDQLVFKYECINCGNGFDHYDGD